MGLIKKSPKPSSDETSGVHDQSPEDVSHRQLVEIVSRVMARCRAEAADGNGLAEQKGDF